MAPDAVLHDALRAMLRGLCRQTGAADGGLHQGGDNHSEGNAADGLAGQDGCTFSVLAAKPVQLQD